MVLKPEQRRYIEEYFSHRLERIRYYPRLYEVVPELMLRLVPPSNEQQQKPAYEMRLEQVKITSYHPDTIKSKQ